MPEVVQRAVQMETIVGLVASGLGVSWFLNLCKKRLGKRFFLPAEWRTDPVSGCPDPQAGKYQSLRRGFCQKRSSSSAIRPHLKSARDLSRVRVKEIKRCGVVSATFTAAINRFSVTPSRA